MRISSSQRRRACSPPFHPTLQLELKKKNIVRQPTFLVGVPQANAHRRFSTSISMTEETINKLQVGSGYREEWAHLLSRLDSAHWLLQW